MFDEFVPGHPVTRSKEFFIEERASLEVGEVGAAGLMDKRLLDGRGKHLPEKVAEVIDGSEADVVLAGPVRLGVAVCGGSDFLIFFYGLPPEAV